VSSGLLIGASFGLKMLDDASGIDSAFQDRNLHPINGASSSQTDPIPGLFLFIGLALRLFRCRNARRSIYRAD
jgi:hypothetical protein